MTRDERSSFQITTDWSHELRSWVSTTAAHPELKGAAAEEESPGNSEGAKALSRTRLIEQIEKKADRQQVELMTEPVTGERVIVRKAVNLGGELVPADEAVGTAKQPEADPAPKAPGLVERARNVLGGKKP